MSRKRQKRDPELHLKRQQCIERLLEIPAKPPKNFWAKEMKMLKDLEERFGRDFLLVFFDRKFKTLAHVATLPNLDKRVLYCKRISEFEASEMETPDIELSDKKFGEDVHVTRPISLKSWLKE